MLYPDSLASLNQEWALPVEASLCGFPRISKSLYLEGMLSFVYTFPALTF